MGDYYFESTLLTKLDEIINLLSSNLQENKHMSAELDALVLEVQNIDGVIESTVAFIQGLQSQLAAIQAELAQQGIDNAKLNELTSDLSEKQQELANAIVAVP